MLNDIVKNNRSYRRFFQDRRICIDTLVELVDMARLTASGRNAQPLKYKIVNEADQCAQIFETLAWAGYLKDWDGPSEGERPAGYIIMCNDTTIADDSRWDQGIASQTIMLGAVEHGLGGCMIASIKRAEISEILNLHETIIPVIVLALGVPKEKVVICDVINDDIKYYRDENQTHYVPKRSLKDILL